VKSPEAIIVPTRKRKVSHHSRTAFTSFAENYNVTGTDVSGLFESTNPADSNFLRLSPSSAARNVAGSGLDAGAQQLANVSDWLLF
jgi:hypothetical protein